MFYRIYGYTRIYLLFPQHLGTTSAIQEVLENVTCENQKVQAEVLISDSIIQTLCITKSSIHRKNHYYNMERGAQCSSKPCKSDISTRFTV